MTRRSTGSSFPGRARSEGPDRLPRDARRMEELLQALGLAPRRSQGQNFLLDPAVAREAASLLPAPRGAPVVEVGGGLGALSLALVEAGREPLTILEKDPRLAAFLTTNLPSRVRVLTADALTTDIPPARFFAGNLPFRGATEILLRLLASGMEAGVFLVQEEVADRLAAAPGSREYGRLTVRFALEGRFSLGRRVPPSAFHPSPRVQGRIVTWERQNAALPGPLERSLERLLAGAFAHRRKMLGGTLPGLLRAWGGPPGEGPERLLALANWPEDWARRRAEEIPPEAYRSLAEALGDGARRSD
jgi:16S rRNA (adenine1518-N6/adenine1519-N6)-dimethyltransferase